jgi:hypothetical protein
MLSGLSVGCCQFAAGCGTEAFDVPASVAAGSVAAGPANNRRKSGRRITMRIGGISLSV